MAGFILDNTLSDNGTVTRGVCQVDDQEMLQKIVETSGIARDTDGIVKDENGNEIPNRNTRIYEHVGRDTGVSWMFWTKDSQSSWQMWNRAISKQSICFRPSSAICLQMVK